MSCYGLKSRIIYREKTFQCPHGLELLRRWQNSSYKSYYTFQCPHGLELLRHRLYLSCRGIRFNALMGLSCYSFDIPESSYAAEFQCPHGLELLQMKTGYRRKVDGFNALMGLSCYRGRSVLAVG